jgi:serine protease Do
MHKKRFMQAIIGFILALAIIVPSGCGLVTKSQNSTTTETMGTATVQQETGQPSANIPEIQITNNGTTVLPSIADVVAAVRPSVVAINVEVVVPSFFGGSSIEQGAGSGWIISSDGIIITNNHVIADAQSITVTFSDGSSLPVDVSKVASDAISDLAVLRVNAQGLPAVTVGDSSMLRVGDWVVAIGNSLGEGIRATQGIISRQDVTISDETGQEISGLLETDAAINPGNSGGPLVNMAGQVIGITNAKHIATGVEGVGYAISSNEAIPLIQELISKGFITWPYLGVNTYTVDALAIREYSLNVDTGVVLTFVDTNSPASRAGLREGDVVVKFNGQTISTASELIRAIHKAKIGVPTEIIFWRENSQNTVTAVLIERPR